MNSVQAQPVVTIAELELLTRWSKVAFAAHSARLVVSILDRFWEDAPEKHRTAIFNAVEMAEALAAEAGGSNNYATNSGKCATAFYEAKAAAHAARKATNNVGLFHAAMACAYAAKTAAYYGNQVDDVERALSASLAAAEFFSVGEKFQKLFRELYTQLINASRSTKWTNSTPVAPKFFQ